MKKLKFTLIFAAIIFFAFFSGNKDKLNAEELIATKIFLIPELRAENTSENLILTVIGQAPLESINLVSINLDFDSEKLSLLEVSYADSFCELPLYEENAEDKSFFACGNFSANTEETFIVARLTFEQKTQGWTALSLNDSRFFQHNGQGTSILPNNETHSILLN